MALGDEAADGAAPRSAEKIEAVDLERVRETWHQLGEQRRPVALGRQRTRFPEARPVESEHTQAVVTSQAACQSRQPFAALSRSQHVPADERCEVRRLTPLANPKCR